MFDELEAQLVPLIREISALSERNRSRQLYGSFDEKKQEEFAQRVVSNFGYDWKRGRLDRVVHPFCISLGGPGDVRITTRFDSDHLSPALIGTFHEADRDGHRLPAGDGPLLALPEEQVRRPVRPEFGGLDVACRTQWLLRSPQVPGLE